MKREVILTHEGLSRLGSNLDFQLKTSNPQDTIICSKSQISFISPVISKLLTSDPTMKDFTLKTPNSSKCSDVLRSLLNGENVKISEELLTIFRTIAVELGNDQIFYSTEEDLTIENAYEIIQYKFVKSLCVKREIDFMAANFSLFNEEDVSNIDLSILEGILSNESLVIESEHKLFKFVNNLISEHGDGYSILLSYLRLEYLEKDDISQILSYINEENIGAFLPSIYRCIKSTVPLRIDFNRKRFQSFVYTPYKGNKFDGIFAHLWREAGRNPVIEGTVRLEETSGRGQKNVINIIDPAKREMTDWYCVTNDSKSSSFLVDFKDKKVALTGYSLKSHSTAWNYDGFFNSWKIEGSNDKNNWTLVDEQKESAVLHSFLADGHWACKKSAPFKYFRIMMIDVNTQNNYCMKLHAIEFFGQIFSK